MSIDLSFRAFLYLSEATFSDRRANQIMDGDAQHKIRKNYQGWDIWFWNREGIAHQKSKDAVSFQNWVDEDYDRFRDHFKSTFEKFESDYPQTLAELQNAFNFFKKIGYFRSERGWDLFYLHAEEQKIIEKLSKNSSKLSYSVFQDDKEFEKEFHGQWSDHEDPLEREVLNYGKIFQQIVKGIEKSWELEKYAKSQLEQYASSLLQKAGLNREEAAWLIQKGPSFSVYISNKEMKQAIEENGWEGLFELYYSHIEKELKSYVNELLKVIPYAFNSINIPNYIKEIKFALVVLAEETIRSLGKEHGSNKRYHFFDLNSFEIPPSDLVNNDWSSFKDFIEYLYIHVESAYRKVSENRQGQHYDEDNFKKFIDRCMVAIKKTIGVLLSFNIRSFHRVPIVVAYQTWGEPSGYGTSNKGGHADKDHVAIFANEYATEDFIIEILAHELGHIVFDRMSSQEKAQVLEIAQTSSAIRDYGRLNYVYPGLYRPIIHHSSGNEFFATMVEYFAKYYGMYLNKVPKLSDFAGIAEKGYNVPTNQEELVKHLQAIKRMRTVFANASSLGNVNKTYAPNKTVTRPPRRLQRRKTPKP